jgi:hypothetical protein
MAQHALLKRKSAITLIGAMALAVPPNLAQWLDQTISLTAVNGANRIFLPSKKEADR